MSGYLSKTRDQNPKSLDWFRVFASVFSGGLDSKVQEALLRKNPDVIIATPGRLIDHLHNTPSFDLQTIEILVLDEADRWEIFTFKYQWESTELYYGLKKIVSRDKTMTLFEMSYQNEQYFNPLMPGGY